MFISTTRPTMMAMAAIVRLSFIALLLGGAVPALGAAAGPERLPLKPVSVLGHLKPPPYPGHLGPELVPVPEGVPLLAEPASAATPTKSVNGVKCQGMEQMAFHIHAHLVVFVNGKSRIVPYGIGIGPPLRGENTKAGSFVTQGSCFSWIHTHAADGIIHLEGPAQRTYTLADFFAIWGQPLSANQVGPAHGHVTALFNGKYWDGDPRRIPLLKHAQIQLEVGKPLIAPVEIKFYGSL